VTDCLQDAAPGRETDFSARRLPLLPEDVCRGQSCMTAQVHFNLWREPAQVEVARLFDQKGRLREVHLPGDGLKPAIFLPRGKKTDRSRIAGERAVGEGIDGE